MKLRVRKKLLKRTKRSPNKARVSFTIISTYKGIQSVCRYVTA